MALRTVILSPGECMTIPESAEVISITVDGDGQINSECSNLPDPTGYLCYKFFWENDNSGSLQDAVFESLIVGDNTYNVPSTYADYNSSLFPPFIGLSEWIPNDPQLDGIVKLGCYSIVDDNVLKIKIPEGLPAPILKISNPSGSGTAVLYMYGVLDEDCDNC